MHIPPSFSDLAREPLQIQPVPDHALIYPPVGFLAWPICGLGNGDEYGYYWPLGKETSEPLVAMMSHDCGALIPVASSLEALARLGDSREVTALVRGEEAPPDDSELDDGPTTRTLPEKLAIDPGSPHLLVANADAAMASNNLDEAEALYLRAIEALPEYTAAHFGLAMLYRRQRKTNLAIRWMLEAVRSPLCFQGASFWADTSLPLNRTDFRRKCLLWLQQTKAEDAPTAAADPLFHVRDRLSFATGVKTNDDFALYDRVIDEYVASGRTLDAIRLVMLVGELMNSETVSFRERAGFTSPEYRDRLRRLFRLGAPRARAIPRGMILIVVHLGDCGGDYAGGVSCHRSRCTDGATK